MGEKTNKILQEDLLPSPQPGRFSSRALNNANNLEEMGRRRISRYEVSVWKPLIALVYLISLAVFKYAIPHVCNKYAIMSPEFEEILSSAQWLISIHAVVLLVYMASQFSLNRIYFGLSLALLALLGTYSGMICLWKVNMFETPSKDETINIARKYTVVHEEIPLWLHHTQLTHRCCGIYNFKDFRAMIYRGKQEIFKEDVPASCCHSTLEAREGICRDKKTPNEVDFTGGITGVFVGEPGWLQMMNQIKAGKVSNEMEKEETSNIHSFTSSLSVLLRVNGLKRGNFIEKGCYDHLLAQTGTLHRILSFFIMLTTGVSFGLGCYFMIQNKSMTHKQWIQGRKKISKLDYNKTKYGDSSWLS